MKLLIALCLFIVVFAMRNKKCIDDEYETQHSKNLEAKEEEGSTSKGSRPLKCRKQVDIDEKSNFTQPFFHGARVRFNQMQRLHLIGGSVICSEEIEHAFLRLLYLYSCIFPAIQGMNETLMDRDYVVFQDVSDLDRHMQTDPNGRLYLHQHKKGEEEKLRLHLVQFIKELNHTNYHGHEGKPKLYREFCSKKYTQHADATKLFESETAGDSIELLE